MRATYCRQRPYADDVPDVADSQPGTALPQIWRVPPWQPAALILVATVLLALVMYGDLAISPALLLGALAAVALVGAGLAVRFVLVADDEGIWVRRVFSVQLVEWNDLSTIETVHVHANTPTLRITRVSGLYVDVPPTLLQPALPTRIRKARAGVGVVGQRLLAIAAEKRA
jgi:hypothetical protein